MHLSKQLILWPCVALAAAMAACGSSSDAPPSAVPGAASPDGGVDEAGAPLVDLRADTNRNGVVDMEDPTEDDGEETWDKQHGAIFLANIDDDSLRCARTTRTSDVDLAACNDAADDVVNGDDDALDLAPLQVRAWPAAPDGTIGSITVSAAAQPYVRLFVVDGGAYAVYDPTTDTFTAAQLRAGVRLALEGKDIVRDPARWDGYVDLTLTVTAPGAATGKDVVRMRVAPVITQHHLMQEQQVFASHLKGDPDSNAFWSDLTAATTAAQLKLNDLATDDFWIQDLFEVGYAAMPAKEGMQTMRVVYRSANLENPGSKTNPLRSAGKVVFTALRGKDVAGIAQYDPASSPEMDSLNSFGNTETIPPYSLGADSYPLGRLLQGNVATMHPDLTMVRMLAAQKLQPPVYIDTSWLLVGHVDETTSFVKAPSPRGWALLLNDPSMAKKMLEDQVAAGNGAVQMFVGLQDYVDPMANTPTMKSATRTISEVLADADVMATSQSAALHVDNQLAVLKKETGLADSEIVRVPYLHFTVGGAALAYQVGTVNGISLSDTLWAAATPHGPQINGKDIMKDQLETALGNLGISVKWVEDWAIYHIDMGEIHCGSNSFRKIPELKWWETGR